MKKMISVVLVLAMFFTLAIPFASAAEPYDGKTVVIATGNLRGDIDVYTRVAALKQSYAAKGANVLLLDAGNYLQGKTYANTDRGLSVYNLMDAVGYDVAAMGKYEFVYGDATTGMVYHGNLHKYYTQSELYNGAAEEVYRTNAASAPVATEETRAAKEAASFKVISSNIAIAEACSGYYDFDATATLKKGEVTFGIYALTDTDLPAALQDGFMAGYTYAAFDADSLKDVDVTVCLNNSGEDVNDADLTVNAPSDGEKFVKVYVIDNKTKEVTAEEVKLDAEDAAVSALVGAVKENALPVIATSTVTLNGADRDNRNGETNLGDFTADALKWYAENHFDGFAKDVPVVAIQNGGNCDNHLYPGDVTSVDLLRALPYSPMGVGIVYLTGEQLLEVLEAATQSADCVGFAQVSGMKYTLRAYQKYDAGEEYGKFFKANSINRVSIDSVGGKPFDEKAVYALIADNFLMNGNDTYYTLKEARDAGAKYLNNGNGVKTRDIVALYLEQVMKGKLDEAYAEPYDRITVLNEQTYVNPYKDVNETDWFYDAVSYTTLREMMNGVEADRFAPNGTVTRAMVVTVLYRLDNSPEASEFENPFEDVADGIWYTDAVCWAADKGIVKGTTSTTYRPEAALTREQCATIFYRYAQYKGYAVEEKGDLSVFPDRADLSGYAEEAMIWANGAKLITGSDNYLVPQGTATRAQLAAILMRFAENVAK